MKSRYNLTAYGALLFKICGDTVTSVQNSLERPLTDNEVKTVLNTVEASKDTIEKFVEKAITVSSPLQVMTLYAKLINKLTNRSLKTLEEAKE